MSLDKHSLLIECTQRSAKAFKIRTARWQIERLNAGRPKRVLKGNAELRVAITPLTPNRRFLAVANRRR
jgi:hypothetical protein